jgi:hypothetical protein
MNTCSKCRTPKPLEDFNHDKRYRSGRAPWCRPCYRDYNQSRRIAGTSIALERQRTYGISEQDQRSLFEFQNGKCAACKVSILFTKAHLDHDHATGRVRSFLCLPCNLTIGHSLEDEQRLLNCAAYLKGWS